MKRVLVLITLIVSMSLAASTVPAAEKHPFDVDDLLKIVRIGDAQVSPDGKWVLFLATEPNLKENKMKRDLWMVGTDGRGLRNLTKDKHTDYNGRWLPDGKHIAYLSVQDGSSQIWMMNPFTGKRWKKTNLPLSIDNMGISQDGGWFSFTIDVYPECDTLECTVKKDKEKADSKIKALTYDELLFRHWDHWEDGKRGHLFVMKTAGGKAIDLTPKSTTDVPTRPWGGPEEISFSPDAKEIAYTTREEPNPAIHTNADIFIIDLKTREKRCLTCENKAWDSSPAYSPDGTYLAYLSMERPGYESDKLRIIRVNRNTGKRMDLSKKWDFSPWSFTWAPDSKTIYAPAACEGEQPIFALDVLSGDWKKTVVAHQNGNVTVSNDKLVFTQNSFTYPDEIFTASLDGSEIEQITDLNTKTMSKVTMSEPEKFWFKGAKGHKIQGWFFKPVGYAEGKEYPLAYFIHGGPQWPWNDRFHFRWNMEIAAGAGYAAATVNFHGSPGFGQKFTDSIRGDWGGKPYKDIMKGLDYVLKENKWIDSNRMCALGASYGGYMINWMEGHTDRFACMVNHDGEFSSTGSYYSTEELWFPEWDSGGGTPFDNPKKFMKWSPDRFVKHWKTPMLVIHGALDFRVVETEGFSTFTALRRRGIPARLLYFPDENHWVLKPQNSKLWHEEVYDWMDRWTKQK